MNHKLQELPQNLLNAPDEMLHATKTEFSAELVQPGNFLFKTKTRVDTSGKQSSKIELGVITTMGGYDQLTDNYVFQHIASDKNGVHLGEGSFSESIPKTLTRDRLIVTTNFNPDYHILRMETRYKVGSVDDVAIFLNDHIQTQEDLEKTTKQLYTIADEMTSTMEISEGRKSTRFYDQVDEVIKKLSVNSSINSN